MGTLHDLAGTETILTWKPLCGQHCQLPSIRLQTYENSRIKSEIVMAASSWPSGRVYVQIILMPCLLSPNRSPANRADPCVGTLAHGPKEPKLFGLFGALGTLRWKVVFSINARHLLLRCCPTCARLVHIENRQKASLLGPIGVYASSSLRLTVSA